MRFEFTLTTVHNRSHLLVFEFQRVGEFRSIELERGGIVVHKPGFALQIGAYPETIKDTMEGDTGVPDLFLVPQSMFDLHNGLSAAELEFPLYFNYYLRKRKLRIICRKHQVRPLLWVIKEALLGPDKLQHHLEYPAGAGSPGYPDLAAEIAYFKADPTLPKGRLRLSDCLEIHCFNSEGFCCVDGVSIEAGENDHYRLDGNYSVQYLNLGKPLPKLGDDFKPPNFGITMIGSGHGFDAHTTTSGFVVWLLGKGVLVDPPANSSHWLASQGIDQRRIHDIILTHCHADHDSGTLQAILQGSRVNLHTTETILRSFMRKYQSLTGLTSAQFLATFNFCPVVIDQPIKIHGAEFQFKYRFHTIPTIGFEAFFQGRSFVYSSDTLYDPALIEKLRAQGLFSDSRAEDLLAFPWHHDLVLHEAGIPPIHTPMHALTALTAQQRQNLILTHISEKSIPPDSGLRLARTGVEHTQVLQTRTCPSESTYQILDVLANVDLFRDLKVNKALEFLMLTRFSQHEAGQTIIKTGEAGECFYMIMSGQAEVLKDGRVLRQYGRYDYFGELALLENQPRSADIIARTHLELLRMSRHDFYCFIRGSGLLAYLRNVARNRRLIPSELWDNHPLWGQLTSFQQSQLVSIAGHRLLSKDQVLFSAGQPVNEYFLVVSGQIECTFPDIGQLQIASNGTMLGPIGRHLELPNHRFQAKALIDSKFVVFPGDELLKFLRHNPGVFLRVLQLCDSQEGSWLE